MRHLLSQLQRHAEERPDAICVELVSKRRGSARLTFREVHRAAARAAGYYRAQGVSRGDIVVLIGTHHLDFYASWLGAVWLGAIPSVLAEPSVRIDRAIYTERLSALLDRVGARALAVDPARR
jgi:acyl-CoA synthetase (AMP-forming)/AMP-acid ligase II